MQTSTAGLMALIGHEGIVLSRYLDSVGVWTLGIGHTKAAGNPDPATFLGELMLGEAVGLFRHDIMKYEAAVAKAVKVPLKQHEFDALVSFHYNTGGIGTASFVKKLNSGDRAGALKGIMDWRKPAEIIPRRTAERDLFKTGKYPEPFAMLYPATAAGKVEWSKGKRIDLAKDLATQAPASTPQSMLAPAKPVPSPSASTSPAGGFLATLFAFLANIFKKG